MRISFCYHVSYIFPIILSFDFEMVFFSSCFPWVFSFPKTKGKWTIHDWCVQRERQRQRDLKKTTQVPLSSFFDADIPLDSRDGWNDITQIVWLEWPCGSKNSGWQLNSTRISFFSSKDRCNNSRLWRRKSSHTFDDKKYGMDAGGIHSVFLQSYEWEKGHPERLSSSSRRWWCQTDQYMPMLYFSTKEKVRFASYTWRTSSSSHCSYTRSWRGKACLERKSRFNKRQSVWEIENGKAIQKNKIRNRTTESDIIIWYQLETQIPLFR